MSHRKKRIELAGLLLNSILLGGMITGCTGQNLKGSNATSSTTVESNVPETNTQDTTTNDASSSDSTSGTTISTGTCIDTTNILTERDMEQEADLSTAEDITIQTGESLEITEEGTYVITGTGEDVTITVEAPDTAKVQLVLNGVAITNADAPAIYIKSCDKVFVTTTASENTLEVTGTFLADGETNLDAAIFSKSDLVLNGVGTLAVTCKEGNGITSKDDLKVTGGTYIIDTALDGMEANDSVVISDGTFTIESQKDAIHCENSDDLTKGYIYISGGTFHINAAEDGIQGITIVQIDGGTFDMPSVSEGIEGTYVIINDGEIDIYATDDGINATSKSTAYDVVVEFNGGSTTIAMGAGDVDAVDANGSIYVNGGTIDITSQMSSFDYDLSAELNGGTVIINGEEVSEIPESMMGGGGHGGNGGGRGSWMR